jgi:hypothetical protein
VWDTGATRCRVRAGPSSNGVLVDDDGSDWIVYHYYDASERGVAKLGNQPLEWTSGGWPVASAPQG